MKFGCDSPELARKQVGKFFIVNMVMSGPTDYMEVRGNALMDRIEAGKDIVFIENLKTTPIDPLTGDVDIEIALLQRVMADYLAWKGS